jgi:hypothetical protein
MIKSPEQKLLEMGITIGVQKTGFWKSGMLEANREISDYKIKGWSLKRVGGAVSSVPDKAAEGYKSFRMKLQEKQPALFLPGQPTGNVVTGVTKTGEFASYAVGSAVRYTAYKPINVAGYYVGGAAVGVVFGTTTALYPKSIKLIKYVGYGGASLYGTGIVTKVIGQPNLKTRAQMLGPEIVKSVAFIKGTQAGQSIGAYLPKYVKAKY